jgi:uncharacterized protein YxjI
MGLLRRRDETPTRRFQMREKMLSIGDDFWVETAAGERALRVNGKALRIRDTVALEDPSGRELFRIQERKLRVRDTMKIERGDETVASVKKAVVGLRDRFSVDLEGGDELRVTGNIVDHEYEIKRGDETIAEVSKRWFRVRDTYGVEVAPGEDDAFVIAVTVCIDGMAHD